MEPEPPFSKSLISLKLPDDGQRHTLLGDCWAIARSDEHKVEAATQPRAIINVRLFMLVPVAKDHHSDSSGIAKRPGKCRLRVNRYSSFDTRAFHVIIESEGIPVLMRI